MILGLWHPGSGLGDQIFCYLAARTTSERLGVHFDMYGQFKGKDFIKLHAGTGTRPFPHNVETSTGKIVVDCFLPVFETKCNYYDPEFNFIRDNSVVDGCTLQDERYYDIEKVRQWIQTEPLEMPDDLCVINFRGGEFSIFPDLFLPMEYWNEAIQKMIEINPKMRFQVHTDDAKLAQVFFPNYEVIHDVALNWRSVRYAKYAIVANSAFGIIPRLLNGGTTIAPRGWARHNLGIWSMPQNYYKKFTYI